MNFKATEWTLNGSKHWAMLCFIFFICSEQSEKGDSKFKNLQTPIYGVKEFVCLLVMNFVLNYLRTREIEWAEIWSVVQSTHTIYKKIVLWQY